MSFSATPQTLYLPSMNYDASNNLDIEYDTIPTYDAYDASATLDISYEFVGYNFKFSSTNLGLATSMSTLDDLHFYTSDPTVNNYLGEVKPSLAIVDMSYIVTGNSTGDLVDGEQTIGVDFIESLAYKIFGSAYFDTFFLNSDALVEDISYNINDSYRNISMESIKAISENGDIANDVDLEEDSEGIYLDQHITSNKNIGRIIMATLYRNDPQRFNVENGLVSNITGKQSLPLVKGDTLQFILTLRPSATQSHPSNPFPAGTFPNSQDVASLTRKYLINLVLSD